MTRLETTLQSKEKELESKDKELESKEKELDNMRVELATAMSQVEKVILNNKKKMSFSTLVLFLYRRAPS